MMHWTVGLTLSKVLVLAYSITWYQLDSFRSPHCFRLEFIQDAISASTKFQKLQVLKCPLEAGCKSESVPIVSCVKKFSFTAAVTNC